MSEHEAYQRRLRQLTIEQEEFALKERQLRTRIAEVDLERALIVLESTKKAAHAAELDLRLGTKKAPGGVS